MTNRPEQIYPEPNHRLPAQLSPHFHERQIEDPQFERLVSEQRSFGGFRHINK